MRTEASVVTPTQPIEPQAPQEPQYRGRRFAHSFCTFQAVGIVLRTPDCVKNRRGGATASFAIKIGGDRDLDILMAGRTSLSCSTGCGGCTPGCPSR